MYHHLRTLPHTIFGPAPVFVVCGCLDEAEGGEDQQSDHCMCFQFPSSPLLSSPLLSPPLLFPISPPFLFPLPLSCPLSINLPSRLSICQAGALATEADAKMPVIPKKPTPSILYDISRFNVLYVRARTQTKTAQGNV